MLSTSHPFRAGMDRYVIDRETNGLTDRQADKRNYIIYYTRIHKCWETLVNSMTFYVIGVEVLLLNYFH